MADDDCRCGGCGDGSRVCDHVPCDPHRPQRQWCHWQRQCRGDGRRLLHHSSCCQRVTAGKEMRMLLIRGFSCVSLRMMDGCTIYHSLSLCNCTACPMYARGNASSDQMSSRTGDRIPDTRTGTAFLLRRDKDKQTQQHEIFAWKIDNKLINRE